jgi:hypothetical protein
MALQGMHRTDPNSMNVTRGLAFIELVSVTALVDLVFLADFFDCANINDPKITLRSNINKICFFNFIYP